MSGPLKSADAPESVALSVTIPGISVRSLENAAGTETLDKRSIAILSISHVLDDLNQGALPTLLPYLITAHHLSYEAAAGLVLTTNLFSSLLQPIFGVLSDKPFWRVNLAPIGLALAGIGVGLCGVMPNYTALLIGAAIGGIGLAAYHPDAARTTNFVSGARKATGMSFFALGGNLGFALGPLAATACVMAMGVRGSVLLLIPAFAGAAILYKHMKGLSSTIAARKLSARNSRSEDQRDRWVPFGFLTLTIICRSVIFFGLNTFLPLYWINELGQTKANGGVALTVLLMASAVGTMLGGKLADRFGPWKISLPALILLPMWIALFLSTKRADLAMLCLLPLGAFLSSTFSIMVVMGQKFLPTRIGLAAGITLGLAGSIGGLVTPALGKIGDRYGLHAALTVLQGVAVVAVVLAVITMILERRSYAK